MSDEQVQVHSGLVQGLEEAKARGGSIVFIDDIIASGTQASRQLGVFFGEEIEKPEGNYNFERLNEAEAELFRSMEVGVVFAVGNAAGRTELITKARALNLELREGNIVWEQEISDFSGINKATRAMRDFLRNVGLQLIRRRFEREGHKDPEGQAQATAAGYGGLEGLIATSFSAPTCTYPAFWCPGRIRVAPIPGETEIDIPWSPLFMRTNMLKHLVLG